MGSGDQVSRRGLFGLLGGRKRVQAAEAGVSGLDPLAVRADKLFKDQRYAEAEALYAKLIEREPEHQEAQHRRALSLLRAGRHMEARAVWDAVLNKAPEDPTALLYQGLSHAQDGSPELAVACWRRYKNYRQVELQREVNLIVALADEGRCPGPKEMVERIESALLDDFV
ncbi:MAG: tetratricopeptide repeat protein [Wenzhouxiangella sp.]